MKKSLVALAALAVVGAASAQSSVTLFGGLDTGVSRYSLGGVSKTLMTTSGLYSSRLGFKGVEDLGGGMSASFHLEAALQNDTGASPQTGTNNQGGATGGGGLTFSRRSTMSLSGGFGEVRLGRDYTPTFWNYTVFDPFGTLGAGAGSNITLRTGAATAARASNSVGYLYNSSNPAGNTGFYGQAMYALGENASNAAGGTSGDGKYIGLRAGFAQGPFNIAASTGKETNVAVGNFTDSSIAGSYDLGMAELMLLIARQNSGVAGTKLSTWELGAKVPVGAGYIPVSYSAVKRNDVAGSAANQFALGYVHNLSKRTALYATYSRLNNKTGAIGNFSGGNGSGGGLTAATGAGNGYDFGVKHTF
jgi:predicted porin